MPSTPRSHSDSPAKIKEHRVTREVLRPEREDDVLGPSAGTQMPVLKNKSLLPKSPTNTNGMEECAFKQEKDPNRLLV